MTKTAKLTVFIILFDFRLILSSKCVFFSLFVLVLNVSITFSDEPLSGECASTGDDVPAASADGQQALQPDLLQFGGPPPQPAGESSPGSGCQQTC